MVCVRFGMLITHPYHAFHAQKASSLFLEEHLLQQKCAVQHLHSGSSSPGSGDGLLLLGQAMSCGQMVQRDFNCFLCSVGTGCSLNMEKWKDWEMHRKMPRDDQPWTAQAAPCKVCQRDVSLPRAPFPGNAFFPPLLTFDSFDHLLPAWATLAWWSSAQSFFFFPNAIFRWRHQCHSGKHKIIFAFC